MNVTEYPRLWVHKKDPKRKMRVMPWWETVDDGKPAKVDELGQMVTDCMGRPCKFGIIVQVGYLLENEHGVWFGMGPRVAEEFHDKGLWVAPKKRKRKNVSSTGR